jgi:cellobiose-specific phosphotransferase system component IIB
MNREEAIILMTETVNQVNMDLGYQHKVPMDELKKMIEQQYEQVKYINTIVYDTMKSKGIIAE